MAAAWHCTVCLCLEVNIFWVPLKHFPLRLFLIFHYANWNAESQVLLDLCSPWLSIISLHFKNWDRKRIGVLSYFPSAPPTQCLSTVCVCVNGLYNIAETAGAASSVTGVWRDCGVVLMSPLALGFDWWGLRASIRTSAFDVLWVSGLLSSHSQSLSPSG